MRRRNHIALDRDDAWRLDTDAALQRGPAPIDVVVRFAARIPVRPVRLMAEGLGLSRGEVERLIVDGGMMSAVHLSRKCSRDFAFTLGG